MYNITKNMIETIGSKSTKYLMNLLLILKKIGVIRRNLAWSARATQQFPQEN